MEIIVEVDGIKFYDSYPEWKRNSIIKTPLAAWTYQAQLVKIILASFNKEVAQQVLYSRDGLKETLLKQQVDLKAASKMATESIQIINELEQKIVDLEEAAKEYNAKA